jgi:hypothetical protein
VSRSWFPDQRAVETARFIDASDAATDNLPEVTMEAITTSTTPADPGNERTKGPSNLAIDVDGWLTELGLTPIERAERDEATSWDIVLDGRKRRALRITLILDPNVALISYVYLAPPIADSFRKSYRQLLRWNDELPFAKFAVTEDERPVLTLEASTDGLGLDDVGRLLARSLAIADLIHDQAIALMGELRRRHAVIAEAAEPDPAGVALLDRYANDLAELPAPEE